MFKLGLSWVAEIRNLGQPILMLSSALGSALSSVCPLRTAKSYRRRLLLADNNSSYQPALFEQLIEHPHAYCLAGRSLSGVLHSCTH